MACCPLRSRGLLRLSRRLRLRRAERSIGRFRSQKAPGLGPGRASPPAVGLANRLAIDPGGKAAPAVAPSGWSPAAADASVAAALAVVAGHGHHDGCGVGRALLTVLIALKCLRRLPHPRAADAHCRSPARPGLTVISSSPPFWRLVQRWRCIGSGDLALRQPLGVPGASLRSWRESRRI